MRIMFRVWLMLGLAVTVAWGEVAVSDQVASLAELEEALDELQGKPAIVRVRASWNVSDNELDKQLGSPCVQDALSAIAWIEWDVTANTDADRQFLEKYGVSGVPVFLLFDTSGNHLTGQDITGYLPAEKIVSTLTEAFELPLNSEFAVCRRNEGLATTKSWEQLIDKSYEYLYDRQEALDADYNLGAHDRWGIDQDTGTLTLSIGDAPLVVADIAIVGTFIAAHGVWRWSWTNPSVDAQLSAPIDVVRRYGAEHRLEKLTDRGWPAEEVDGWEMAAIANYLLQGKGVYRAPAGDLGVFVVITDIRKVE